ncbi:MAG: pilus assembly PilX N-terminal domain-containing protein [Candidatus Saccharimonadales bacterium]|nr:pilus assembly PilX N-terminal domain-containing protein [Candidatus Saccharimonadales bacterium]
MKSILHKNEHGAIALITVMFMALLLTVLTTSFIRITVNEQRQATDDDLTKRAFFAAESGIEDAKIALDRYLNETDYDEADLNGEDCDPAQDLQKVIEDGLNDGIDAAYTCQLISIRGLTYEAEIDAWSSRTIPLNAVLSSGAASTFSTMTIKWHDPGRDSNPYSLRGAADIEFPDISGWGDQVSLIRLQVTSYPTTNPNFTSSDVDNTVIFLNPTAPSGAGDIDFTAAGVDGSLTRGNCTAGVSPGSYACEATLAGFDDADRNYFVRISSLYRKATVEVTLDGGTKLLDGVAATIDVTGRAGDVYRRVQASVSLKPEDFLPDAALTSARDVCKDFYVTDDAIDFPLISPGASPDNLCR